MGIKVAVQKVDADQLIQRLQAEGAASKAEILIIADAGRLHLTLEEGLLQAVDAPGLQPFLPICGTRTSNCTV
jgi:iron(III) transport system substrate-binding protein